MKVKTSELIGPALDWAVAEVEGIRLLISGAGKYQKVCYIPKRKRSYYEYTPSTNWKQGGPLIEREWIELENGSDLHPDLWAAAKYNENGEPVFQRGPTPLIAAMRCFVASKLGEEVELPEDICT